MKPAKGALSALVGLLLVSGIIRGSEAGSALAEGMTDDIEPAEVEQPILSDTPAELVRTLLEREAELDRRELQIEDRLRALAQAEQQIDQQLAKLEEAEEALRTTIAMAETASSKDIAQLVAVYENMKPAEAAELFEEMDPAFSAGFIAQMRPDSAAAILAGLEPMTSYAISVILAGRNADVPTE